MQLKRPHTKEAFTLMELIVSLMLVSIILLGIISINMVLSTNSQDYGQKYLVKSETQTVLNHILGNASLAFGTANANQEAILTGLGGATNPTFCIHQQPPSGVPADQWVCYTWTNTAALPYQVNWCTEQYNAGADPRGADSCVAPTGATLLTGPTFLGSAHQNPAVSFIASPPAGQPVVFSIITLVNCLNNSLASCTAGGTSTDQADNPEISLSASVIPLQASSS